ncbi:MAG: hypothetical protein QG632_59 [Candidatus Dependentiae bacterium]|nr:hypothetical protein [Candidatus Dependentiae bacterium]
MKNFTISLFVIALSMPLIGTELTLPALKSAARSTLSTPAVSLATAFCCPTAAHSVVAATHAPVSGFSPATEKYARDVEMFLLSVFPEKTCAETTTIKNIFTHYLRTKESFTQQGKSYDEKTYVAYLTLLLWGAHELKDRTLSGVLTETFNLLEWCNKEFSSYSAEPEITIPLTDSAYESLAQTKLAVLKKIDATKEDDRQKAVVDLFDYIANTHLYSKIPNCAPTSESVEWFLSIIEAKIALAELNSTSERKALEKLFHASLAEAITQKNEENRITQATRPKKASRKFFNFEVIVD